MGVEQLPLRVGMVFVAFPVPSETFAVRDVRALRQLGHTVETLPLRRGSEEAGLAGIAGYVRSMIRKPGLGGILKLASRIVLSRGWTLQERVKCLLLIPPAARIAHKVITSQPDIVHLFWGHYPALVALLTKPYAPRTQFTLFLGAYDLEKKLPVSRWAADTCSQIFTHAHVNRRAIEDFIGQRPLEVVHRGIDLDPYDGVGMLALKDRDLRIFTAGRLIAGKGFDQLIRTFASVAPHHPESKLAIAGDGPELGRLRQLCHELKITDRVEFLGWCSEEEVRRQLFRARVFMLLSVKPGERLPNAVKEGMAAGCICISSPSPGIEELIDHGSDGFVCAPDDLPAILEAVDFGFDSDEAQRMSHAAMEKIRSGFDVAVSAKRYTECWNRITRRDLGAPSDLPLKRSVNQ